VTVRRGSSSVRSRHLGVKINNPEQLGLAIPPWVGDISTGDGHESRPLPEKKRRVFCVTGLVGESKVK